MVSFGGRTFCIGVVGGQRERCLLFGLIAFCGFGLTTDELVRFEVGFLAGSVAVCDCSALATELERGVRGVAVSAGVDGHGGES